MSDTIAYGIYFSGAILGGLALSTVDFYRTGAEVFSKTDKKNKNETYAETRIYNEDNAKGRFWLGDKQSSMMSKYMFSFLFIITAFVMLGYMADVDRYGGQVPFWRRQIIMGMLAMSILGVACISIAKMTLENKLYKVSQTSADRQMETLVQAGMLSPAAAQFVYSFLTTVILAMMLVMIITPHSEEMSYTFAAIDQDASRWIFIAVVVIAAIDAALTPSVVARSNKGKMGKSTAGLWERFVLGTSIDIVGTTSILLRVFSPIDSGPKSTVVLHRLVQRPLGYIRSKLGGLFYGTTLNVYTPHVLQYAVYATMFWFLSAFYNDDIEGAVAWLLACGPGILMTLMTGMPHSWMEWFLHNQLLFWTFLVLDIEVFPVDDLGNDDIRFLSSMNHSTLAESPLGSIPNTTTADTMSSTNNWVSSVALFAVVFISGMLTIPRLLTGSWRSEWYKEGLGKLLAVERTDE